VTLNEIDGITPWLPNITVTTIPMESIKARYYLYYKRYDKAIPMLKKGISANPYLLFSENLLTQAYLEKGMIDSAFYFSKKAFHGLPNNALHAANHAKVLSATKDTMELNKAFNKLSAKTNPVIWRNFILAYGASVPVGDPGLVSTIKRAIELYPGDIEIKNLQRAYVIGFLKLLMKKG